jgi:hypothetical protein
VGRFDRRYKNKARCISCDTILESKDKKDFKICRCKAIYIAGGNESWCCGGDLSKLERIMELKDENHK